MLPLVPNQITGSLGQYGGSFKLTAPTGCGVGSEFTESYLAAIVHSSRVKFSLKITIYSQRHMLKSRLGHHFRALINSPLTHLIA